MAGPIGGLERKAWGLLQGTFDTFEAIAATDAFDFAELVITPTIDYQDIRSHVGTLSFQGEIEGKRGGTWSGSFYMSPAAAGTAPDIGFLLKHALGTETDGASSVVYTLNDDAPSGIQLVHYASDDFLETIGGGWIETIEFLIEGGSPPMINVSGGFASYGCLYQGVTVGATEATGQTVISLTSGHARKVRPGVYVQFPDDDNGGAGYRVTAVDLANDTMTITPALAGSGLESGDDVTPLIPSQTLGGTELGGIACGLTLDSDAIGLIRASISLATGIKGLDREASTDRPNRLHRVDRRVTGELQMYYLDESAEFAALPLHGDEVVAAIVRAGADTAGARVKLSMPAILLKPPTWTHPDDNASDFTCAFTARQASAAGDELTVTLD